MYEILKNSISYFSRVQNPNNALKISGCMSSLEEDNHKKYSMNSYAYKILLTYLQLCLANFNFLIKL